MAPFRLFKGTLAEGGIRSPLIVAGPGVTTTRGLLGIRERPPTHALLSVMDLTPTFLEMAGVEHPSRWDGHAVAPLQGGSLVPLLAGGFTARNGPHEWLGFELGGEKAVRRGGYKAVLLPKPFGNGDWRLYRLELDPAELYDDSERHPEVKAALVALWEEYARDNGVETAEPEVATEGAEPPAQKSSPSAR
jgi:arylsulfatase